VWDWLNELNAAQFAGYADWQLPESHDCTGFGLQELESIVAPGFTPTIDPLFGATASGRYWSTSIVSGPFRFPVYVDFATGNDACNDDALERSPLRPYHVRAAR
jgi:hypothetical protein